VRPQAASSAARRDAWIAGLALLGLLLREDAVASFAFFGVYFLWRHHRPRLARAVLAGVLLAGLAFGWAQWARGAHFVSHGRCRPGCAG